MSTSKTARLVARNVKPVFQHDCESCWFIGRLDGQDLYLCARDGSYLRRFGDRDHENGSLGTMTPEGSAYSLIRTLVLRGLIGNEYRTVGGGEV